MPQVEEFLGSLVRPILLAAATAYCLLCFGVFLDTMSGQQETNIDGAAVGANVADVPPPILPQQAAPHGKPADVQKAFFEQLVASKLPQELIAYTSSENTNALADLP